MGFLGKIKGLASRNGNTVESTMEPNGGSEIAKNMEESNEWS